MNEYLYYKKKVMRSQNIKQNYLHRVFQKDSNIYGRETYIFGGGCNHTKIFN